MFELSVKVFFLLMFSSCRETGLEVWEARLEGVNVHRFCTIFYPRIQTSNAPKSSDTMLWGQTLKRQNMVPCSRHIVSDPILKNMVSKAGLASGRIALYVMENLVFRARRRYGPRSGDGIFGQRAARRVMTGKN